MKAADVLLARRADWEQLERWCNRLPRRPRRISGPELARCAALDRAVCADLALAEA